MINMFQKHKPVVNERQRVFAVYNSGVHRANAIALLISRNPYLALGRLPITAVDVARKKSPSTSFKPGEDDARLNVVLTPSLWRLLQSFTISAVQDSLSQMADVERKLSAQVSKSTLSSSIVNNAISMLGLDIRNLLDNEIANVMPVPFNRVALTKSGQLSFMSDYLASFIASDNFIFGSESADEGCPMIMAGTPSIPALTLKDSLAGLIEIYKPLDNAADLGVAFETSKRSSISVTLPTNIVATKWKESMLDFLLVFQKPDDLKNAMDTLSGKFETAHLEAYLSAQQIQLHKDNHAAAAIITYYQVAPYIKDLKVIAEVLKHPFLSKRAASQYVNLLSHDKVKDMLDFIAAFQLPGITSLEYSQSNIKTVKVPGLVMEVDCQVPEQIANEFFDSAADYDQLFGAAGVLTKLIELDRVLTSNKINKDILLATGNILGLSYKITRDSLILQPETDADFVVTDGHRMSSAESQALGLTRQHIVSISDANKVRISLTSKTYKTFDADVVNVGIHPAVSQERFDVDTKAKADDLLKKGFVDTDSVFFFLRKAYLPDNLIQAIRSSKAAAVVPFPLAGIQGAEDNFYRAKTIEDLLNQLGYFGASVSILDGLPFAKRFIIQGEDGGYVLKYENLIIGPTGLRFITHTIFSLQSVFTHWKFTLVDSTYGRQDDMTLIPALLFISLPEIQKAALTMRSAYNASFDADLASVFNTIQD